MSENDRDNRGHFQTEHSDREYLAAVANREPAGTSEIAEEVGVTRQNADQRLRRLEDQGKVSCKKVGTSLVWSLEEETHVVQHVDPDDSFWEAETYPGEEMSAEDIDDVLYS
ncbi:winged helix-turn-helix domain-containing protein [Natrialba swarupiae]|uniref:Winged helix-turn-helix transcriptional regulator n=1 Tax=Natrialba swarupiae TaxID=2448032 RepID=A0A5D5AIM0_9EURY|nr:winged helix-turn-helix domain-containing protein [Natrialba swarupiae]TYT61698.1 winged helix-turn-helix transcriptional regulator [Natrialba swarupiae]